MQGASLSDVIAFDLHYFGDGCIFLDMVVQPVFNFLAEQVGLMGQAGEQPALRLGYDDVNESACIAQVGAILVYCLCNPAVSCQQVSFWRLIAVSRV